MLGSQLKEFITGKRTLAILCALLLVTNIITLAIIGYNKALVKGVNDYPFIDFSRNFIPQEHFIVNIQPLREKLFKISNAEEDGTVSVYFEFLNTGSNIQINNDSRFYPASLVKLPTAMAVMKKVESGKWKLNNRLVLMEQDKDSRYGKLYQQPTGTSLTIDQLLEALLVESDNTAHHILMRNMSDAELDNLKDAIGLEDLFDDNKDVSSKEYSRIFRALYNSSYLTRDGSQKILQLLARTPFNHTLPSGMPKDTTFSHKIGEDRVENNYLDSGIVYLPNRPYLVTVMIKKHSQEDANKIMKQISKAAYEYVNGYSK